MMNYKQLAEEFWQKGFLVCADFFNESLMAELDGNIRQYFGDDPGFRHEKEFLEKSKTEVIPWFPQNSDLEDFSTSRARPFDQAESDTCLRQLTRAVLGENWGSLYSMVMFSKRGSSGQAWHQDCPPENPARFNLNRLIYTRDLDDHAGGQTLVVPGSHRKGVLPTGDPTEDLDEQVVLRPRKGMLILLHGHTWHRVLPMSTGVRYSTNFRACPEGTPANITDISVYRNMRYQFSTSSVIENR